MDFHKSHTIFTIALTICFSTFLLNSNAQAPSDNFVSNTLPQLKQINIGLSQNVLPLLALIQDYEKSEATNAVEVAKVIHPSVTVRESDNSNATAITVIRLNEEYIITDKREKWYKIKTEDGRDGWVFEEEIQIITRQQINAGAPTTSKARQELKVVLSQMVRYKANIDELVVTARALCKQVEDDYTNLTIDKKQELLGDYKVFLEYKAKIEKYYSYTLRFFRPYEELAGTIDASPISYLHEDVFKGTVSADIGQSSYKNMTSTSATSRKLGFSGVYQPNKNTRADVTMHHQSEVIQTPFMNTTLDAGVTQQFANKLVLSGNLGYNKYDDKATDQNSFGVFHTGANAVYNPVSNASIFARANFQSKQYDRSGLNNYQSLSFDIGTSLTPNANNNIKFQFQGNFQTSETDYLSFSQVSPQFIYLHKATPQRSVTLGLDYNLLKFAYANRLNDFQRYRANFKWRNTRSKKVLSKNLDLIFKQYPYNNSQDYTRIGYTSQRRKGSAVESFSSSSSLSTILTVYTQREDMYTTDYFDLRWDKSKNTARGFFNFNVFNRLWNNFEYLDSSSVDHVFDFFAEFGPRFQSISEGTIRLTDLKLGFILGGHVYYNIDEDYFMRNGNSVRTGIGFNSHIKIKRASLEIACSYEHSWILVKETIFDPFTGDIVYGENLPSRQPQAFQFRIDFRQPLYDNWDIHFNLSTYTIKTDATEETSINPIDKKSNLRFSGGLIYRFAL
ncbi:MAG: SH3 domain-containing protein [Bacteroidales bacterium]|nr:SH3 domain-containing protein [Bacteroidales bacterium]